MLAYTVLVLFLPFALLTFRRLPRAQAVATVVLCGSLFLPESVAIDLPVIPPMDKEYITYLSVLIAAYASCRGAMARARPFRGLELIVVAMFVGNVGTMLMNSQPMMDEGRMEDGLGFYWLFAQTTDDVLTIAVPYLVGRALITSVDDLYVLLGRMVVICVGYTGLILIEFLLSIPFRSWNISWVVYGVGVAGHPNFRWGFTQPIVFFENGLALASFMALPLIAAAAMVKSKLPLPRIWRLPTIGARSARLILTAGLIMTLNVAGNVYGLVLMLVQALLPRRMIVIAGLSLATLGIVYPALRMADVFPHHAIVEFAAEYDASRARSLGGRFDEEDFVLGQLGNRLWVGWGTYARTPGVETFGEGETGLDGWWTIRAGSSGILGVLLYYLVFAIPVWRAWLALRRTRGAAVSLVGAIMCMVGCRMIDLIINGWWNCFPVFLAGALAGMTGSLRQRS